MRIDLIRHGQVPGNLEHRYVGSTEESLTEAGRRQAESLRAPMPELVFASPRLRCRETAEILYPGCETVVIPELAECDFGRFEYRNYRELSGDPDYQAWIDSGGTIGFPGGEDMAAFRARSKEGFRKCLTFCEERGAVGHISLVVHGGSIMAILAEYAEPAGDYFSWQCGNLQGYTGEWNGAKIVNINKSILL